MANSQTVLNGALEAELEDAVVVGRDPIDGSLYLAAPETMSKDHVVAMLVQAVAWLTSTDELPAD